MLDFIFDIRVYDYCVYGTVLLGGVQPDVIDNLVAKRWSGRCYDQRVIPARQFV